MSKVIPCHVGSLQLLADWVISYHPIANNKNEAYQDIISLFSQIISKPCNGLLGATPSRRSLTIMIDPTITSPGNVINYLLELLEWTNTEPKLKSKTPKNTQAEQWPPRKPQHWEIPVVYGGHYGPDLETLANRFGISIPAIIKLHTSKKYKAELLGFAPGFAYLEGLHPLLSIPRKDTPRQKVSAGSVAIAEGFTAIYPFSTSGGWHILGWTPIQICQWNEPFPFRFIYGDTVRFYPISHDEAKKIQSADAPQNKSNYSSYSGEPVLEVIDGGLLSTIQDQGRFCFQHMGVPMSGPMDRLSALTANLLANNHPGSPVLEFTHPPPIFKALASVTVAITGDALGAVLNGKLVGSWQRITLKEGDRLAFQRLGVGNWCYLDITGGISVPSQLKSFATYTPAELGGINGRALLLRDCLLRMTNKKVTNNNIEIPPSLLPRTTKKSIIHVLPGPEIDFFSQDEVDVFWKESWSLTPRFDRAGYCFTGEGITNRSRQIEPDGTFPGIIQIPGDGNPMLIFWDGPVTGGYPRIAAVSHADLDRAAQLSTGQKVTFQKISVAEALSLTKQKQKDISRIISYVKQMP